MSDTKEAFFSVNTKLASILGENYRSTEFALKELVDNAWDADSENVRISLPDPLTTNPIVIEDDGTGMTDRELRLEYLSIANDRTSRKGETTAKKNRKVKGRKGIGKFAGLVAAEVMEIETRAIGTRSRLIINKNNVLHAKEDLEKIALPIIIENCNQNEHGTKLSLINLHQNLAFPNPEKLKQILILEYGRQNDFKIMVNNEYLGIEDIPGQSFEKEESIEQIGKIKLKFTIADGNKPLKQSGIIVRVHGKIVGNPTFFGLEDSEEIPNKLLKKLYGEIEADGLADDVTADWGAIIENSNAFQVLKNYVSKELNEELRNTFKKEIGLVQARLQKQIDSELSKLPEYKRDYAKKALEKIIKKFYCESEDKILTVISVILDALEKDEYWTVLSKIDAAKDGDIELFAETLSDFGILDIALIIRQMQKRLKFLDELDSLVNNPKTLEGTIHKALENNLWAFGSQFSLMSSNKTLKSIAENNLPTKHEISVDHERKRPDLILSKNIRNDYLLIEFKAPNITIGRDTERQALEYRDDLNTLFPSQKIDIIILGGKTNENISSHNQRPDVKYMSYLQLISDARTELEWLIKELRQDI